MRRLLLVLTAFLLLSTPAQASWSWPVRGDVITPYRNGTDPYAGGQHRGIDIAAAAGTPVVAAAGGEVRFAGTAGSSGLTVSVRTADGFDTSYLHLSAIAVRAGDARLCRRAPGRGRNDGHALGRPAAPALRRTRSGHTTRLHRPALDAAARDGAPSERSTTSGAGTGTDCRRGQRPPPSPPAALPGRRRRPAACLGRRPYPTGRVGRHLAPRRPSARAGATPRARPAVLARASSRVCATTSTEDRTIAGTGPARRRPARPGAVTAWRAGSARRSPHRSALRTRHRLRTNLPRGRASRSTEPMRHRPGQARTSAGHSHAQACCWPRASSASAATVARPPPAGAPGWRRTSPSPRPPLKGVIGLARAYRGQLR